MRPALSYDALRQVVAEQQKEIEEIKKKEWITRSILQETRSVLDKNWIKVIVGIRRCGKSVFAHQLLREKRYGYINFDDERFIGMTSNDFNKLLQYVLEFSPGVKHLLFDEVQNIEGWELFLNRLQRQGYNLVITGSNSKLLSKELATHLVGRYVTVELFPFSFREFLQEKKFSWTPKSLQTTKELATLYNLLNEYLHFGGFPDMVMQGYYPDYLRELYAKIIARDITYRYRIKLIHYLKEVAIYSHANLAKHLTFQKVKNTFDIRSVHTVKNHFQYLFQGYLVYLLDPFSHKYGEQVKKPRKIYTIDNGLTFAINPKFGDDKRAAIENLVFQQLHRRSEKFSYYGSTKDEVTFVLHTQKQVEELIHVVWALQDVSERKRHIRAVVKAAKALKCKNASIITWDEEGVEKLEDLTIKIIPLWKWLLKIP